MRSPNLELDPPAPADDTSVAHRSVAISAILIASTYAANIWNAQSFPFMAQDLFLANGERR